MIDALYQKSILKQAALAAGHGVPDTPAIQYTLQNPLCGDRITVYLSLEQDRIQGFRHETRACVLCQASASLLAQKLAGETASDMMEITSRISRGLAQDTLEDMDWPAEKWRAFAVFAPVAGHRNRHTCVTLPFQAIEKALRDGEAAVKTTEGTAD